MWCHGYINSVILFEQMQSTGYPKKGKLQRYITSHWTKNYTRHLNSTSQNMIHSRSYLTASIVVHQCSVMGILTQLYYFNRCKVKGIPRKGNSRDTLHHTGLKISTGIWTLPVKI